MKALFPYKTVRDVSLRITDLRLDNVDVGERISSLEVSVDLAAPENKEDWESARLTVMVEGPAEELDAFSDVECVLVADCGRTNYRTATPLAPQPTSKGRWHGEMVLEREFWYGQAELHAVIAATVDNEPRRIIGTSAPWSLLFDDLPNRPTSGSIRITWVDFRDPEDKPWLKRYAEAPAFLKIDPHEPQLFLNRGFDGLPALLSDDRRRYGLDKALHDQVRSALADKTWIALFNAALQAVEIDEEERAHWPAIEWQRTVLEVLLQKMYSVTPEEALETAWTASRSEASSDLQAELWHAAAAVARGPKLLRDGIRALSNQLDEG